MELIAKSLKILHKSKNPLYKDFDPFHEIIEYKETIIREDKSLLDDFKEMDLVVDFLKAEMEKIHIDYLPCHLDAWPENLIRSGDKIYLIDWEYSSNYSKLWDLVSVGLECQYSKGEEELFHEKYFGRPALSDEIIEMDILRILMDIYWSIWTLAKISCGGEGLYEYALSRYKRGLSNLEKLNK